MSARAGAGPGTTFVNPTQIGIPPGGPATPYPSPISVSGLSGEITSLSVTLLQLTHTAPDDLDILLVGPGGDAVLLMSDVGKGSEAASINLTFTDSASNLLPETGRLMSGAYRPTDYVVGDVFPGPVPAGPYGSKLSDFAGRNPNGTWRLFVVDDTPQNGGVIGGGWRLDINTTNFPVAILKQPEDETVLPGGTARFHVDVSGTPPFGFAWLHSGEILVPFGQGTETLLIPNVQAADAGTYSVIVTNAANRNGVRSRPATLNVVGPLAVIKPPEDQFGVPPGSDVFFDVGVAGTPPIYYQWRLNGIWLTNETNATLVLRDVHAADGGHYSVIVWNGDKAMTTRPATMTVRAATIALQPADIFKEGPIAREPQGVVQGTSEGAGKEPGEPILFGGGRTVWFQWLAPFSGIARFTTRGSALDTLLAVHRGSTTGGFDGLDLVTQDDDRGGFYTSAVVFNADANQLYQIQVDGFGLAGDGGFFTVSWFLEDARERVPVIVMDPAPQAVRPGDRAEFEVRVEPTLPGVPPPTFQWLFNGKPLEGADGPKLVIPRALSEHVGFYSVLIRNEFGRFVDSVPVALQLGTVPGVFLHERSEAMFLMSGGSQFVPIGVGNSVFSQAPWPALPEESDPTPCNSPFVGTLWQGLSATNNGPMQISTAGSLILTRLAVYRLTGSTNDFGTNNPPLVCDLQSASNGLPCVATFGALQGTNYTVVVEGYQSSTGAIQVVSLMGAAPAPTNTLKYCVVESGGSVQLDMPATNWYPAPVCQWRLNGDNLINATNATLTLTNFAATNVGIYSVVISNFVSVITNDVAYLALAGPLTLGFTRADGGASFLLRASNALPFVLEATTNLSGPWSPIATNPDPCLLFNFTNSGVLGDPQRFFRAAPWSTAP
jgi:hypothetical protein